MTARRALTGAILAVLLLAGAARVRAADRYAVVVSGASGGAPYADQYAAWRTAFVDTLRIHFAYPRDHLFVLGEDAGDGVAPATRESVRDLFGRLRARVGKDDLLLVLLIGHGTDGDAGDAKFNLVGPDLTASEWADLLAPLGGHLVFIDTTSASFPFLQKIAAPGRVVLTATDSAVQTFETVFPEFFVKAFDDRAADLDKNGRVSLWEAFSYASAGVRRWFEERGRLPTERPLLDDTGRGIGREAQNPGADGAVARATYLESADRSAGDDTALAELLRERSDLEGRVEALKGRKDGLPAAEYQAELERLLVQLARVSMRIRDKS